MAEVHKESEAGDVSIWLSPTEAVRLASLVYNVEDIEEKTLYALLMGAGAFPESCTFGPVLSHSVTLIDLPNQSPEPSVDEGLSVSRFLEALTDILPEDSSLHLTSGTYNTMINITVPQ